MKYVMPAIFIGVFMTFFVVLLMALSTIGDETRKIIKEKKSVYSQEQQECRDRGGLPVSSVLGRMTDCKGL